MKTLYIILLLLPLMRCSYFEDKYDYEMDTHDLVSLMVSDSRSKDTERITVCIIKYSVKYNIDALVMSKLARVESDYRFWRVNAYTGCLGLFQISPKWWSHLLYYIDDGKLGKHIKKKGITNTDKYFLRIGYNTQMACFIMSNYVNDYDGDYVKAIKKYGGWLGSYGRKNPEGWELYKNKIFGEDI